MTLADTKEAFEILDAYGSTLSAIEVGAVGPGIKALPSITLSYSAEEGATQRGGKLTAQGYQFIIDPAGNPQGKELVDEKWLEAKPSGGSWTPIGGSTMLAITPETQVIELRLNVPANAETKGQVLFSLAVLFGPDGPP